MKKGLKNVIAVASAVTMLGGAVGSLVGCNKPQEDDDLYTYHTYTTTMPGNWNELSSEDENDNQIMSYIGSSFFAYDYKFDEAKGGKFTADGKINADAIVDGEFTVTYDAATALDDVTSTYAEKYGYTDEQVEKGGYAWKITLRNDLKWDDGTPIDAGDFVYTMEQQLDPLFKNKRASEYYNNAVKLINAREYLYKGEYGYANVISADMNDDEYFDVDDATVNDDGTLVMYDGEKLIGDILLNINSGGNWGSASLEAYYKANISETLPAGYLDMKSRADASGYVKLTKADVAIMWDMIAQLQGYEDAEAYAADEGDYAYQEWEEFCFFGKEYEDIDFSEVGIFNPTKYELVVALTQPLSGLKDAAGNLSYNAAYSFASLPLVKKALYEECKIAPGASSTLWTSNYNTTLATTASWGPYKLTQFQSGKSYRLDRNPNWYGYGLDANKDQYLIDRIDCEQIADTNTRWMNFLDGTLAVIGVDVNHDEFARSKYAVYAPRIAMFSYNINADLSKLVNSGRNNGILAITEFRKAISLSIDRAAYNAKLSIANQPCYGLLDSAYYYDIANSTTLDDQGVYRNTPQAKKAILKAYGYYEEDDGTWSNGGLIDHRSLEDAYKSVNGYDLTQARELVEEAYSILTADPETYGYDASKPIQIMLGASEPSDLTNLEFATVQEVFDAMVEGTSLEGKVKVVLNDSLGDSWAEEFRAGNYELCTGGWGNAPFDPFYMIGAYIIPGTSYTPFWNVASETMTFTLPEGDHLAAGQTLTLPILNWYNYLTNDSYWGPGAAEASVRLEILAALEENILGHYYAVPYASGQAAQLLSAQFSYINDNYNTMMSFGGQKYMRVNYTNGEWRKLVKKNYGGDLTNLYKQTD